MSIKREREGRKNRQAGGRAGGRAAGRYGEHAGIGERDLTREVALALVQSFLVSCSSTSTVLSTRAQPESGHGQHAGLVGTLIMAIPIAMAARR